jgi:hypothetical protein
MTDLESDVAAMLHDAVPAPTVTIDYDAVQSRAHRRRRTARLVPLAAAAAVAIPIIIYGLAPGSTNRGQLGGNAAPATNSTTPLTPAGQADCPATRYLPNTVLAIDYVDFVQVYGRQYLADANPHHAVTLAELGEVVGRVRCTVSDLTADGRHKLAGPLRDGDAAFLPVGTELHSVAGYDPQCRLGAEHDGRIATYLAQHEVDHHTAALPCALEPRLGVAYPFDVSSHCGIHYAVFAGRIWKAVKAVPESSGIGYLYTPGTMTLLDPNTLLFTIDTTTVHTTVETVTFHPTTDQPPGCD